MILWITTPAKGKAEAQCSLSSFIATTAGTTATDRASLIAEINAHPGVLWTAGENERFPLDLPVGASGVLAGAGCEARLRSQGESLDGGRCADSRPTVDWYR